MMEYRVIRDFADARDKGHIYHAGDIFPRAGVASESRIAELSGYGNRIGAPLIAAVMLSAPAAPDSPNAPTVSADPATIPDAPEADSNPAAPPQEKPQEQEKPKTRRTTKAKAEAQKD